MKFKPSIFTVVIGILTGILGLIQMIFEENEQKKVIQETVRDELNKMHFQILKRVEQALFCFGVRMITNDDILEVRLYQKERIEDPKPTDTKTIFQKKCYQSWCIDSIVERLFAYAIIDPEMQIYDVCYNLTPIDIIEEFKADMEYFLEGST